MEPARFAELFDRHYPAILRYLRRRIGPDLADNLAAETFTLAFRRRHQYRAEHPDAAAWLYAIAGNLLRQHARTEVRRLRASARVVPNPIGPDIGDGVAERIDATAAARRAALAVADLPAEQREVLLLSCVGFGWYEGRAMRQRKGERCWVRLVGKGEQGVLLGTEVAWWGVCAGRWL